MAIADSMLHATIKSSQTTSGTLSVKKNINIEILLFVAIFVWSMIAICFVFLEYVVPSATFEEAASSFLVCLRDFLRVFHGAYLHQGSRATRHAAVQIRSDSPSRRVHRRVIFSTTNKAACILMCLS